MNYHQSNVFLQDLSNAFHCWFNLSNFHPGVSQQFMVVFLIVFSYLKTGEVFLLNLGRSPKIRGSSFMPSSLLFRSWGIFLYPSEEFHEFFPLWSSEGHHFRRFLCSQFSTLSSKYSSLMSLRSSPYSYGGSFKITLPLLSYQFICSFHNPTGGSLNNYPSLC